MSLELKGTYWRIADLAEKLGMSYGQTHTLLANKKGLIKLGITVLIPDKIAQDIIGQYGSDKIGGVKVDTMSLSEVAQSLGTGSQVIYQLIQLGLPVVRHGKKKRIKKAVYDILEPVVRKYQDKFSCVPEKQIGEIYAEVKKDLKQA